MRAEFQRVAGLAGGTANLGCAPHHESSKNRTGKIACATKAMPQIAHESSFLAALEMTTLFVDLGHALEFERLQRLFLRSDEELAAKSAFGGTAVEGFFRGKAREIGIIVFLRKMRKHEIARARVKAFRIAKIFADGVIREMARAAENALLDDPRIRPDFEHVQIVIGFEQQTIGVTQMDFDEFGHVAEIGDERHLRAVGAKREADWIGSVVGNLKGVDVDIADGEVLPGLNGFDAAQSGSPAVSGRAR